MRRSALSPSRLVATALVALWALHPLAEGLHAQHHVHRYCPEHRAFEEAPLAPAAAEAPAPASSAGLSSSLVSEAEAAGVHRVCPLVPGGVRTAPGAADRALATAPPAGTRCAAADCPDSLCPLPVLATAPKASPPATC